MRLLPSSDCEKLLAVTGDLYLSSDNASLTHHLLRSIQSLIPSEFGACHLIQPTRRQIVPCYEPERPPLPVHHKEFWRLSETHPLNPVLFTNPAKTWKLSDVISRQAFHQTEFYTLLYRPLHVDCELVAVLPDHEIPGRFVLISLHRQRTDFSERERMLLNLLLPHVAKARRRLTQNSKRSADVQNGDSLFSEEAVFHEWLRWHTPWHLTRRESEVLFWLCQGKTNSEIGRILGIAERTAETHALNIYPKMGVENRYTAIATLNRRAAIERQ